MNVLIIHGSPRKNGNSTHLANHLGEALSPAETRHVHISDLTFRGCLGCMACRRKSEECVINDDLTDVLRAMHTADVVVFAAPVYHGGFPGEMKCLIDRCFSLLSTDHFEKRKAGVKPIPSRLAAGKTAVTILAQGQAEQAYAYVAEHFETRLLDVFGFGFAETLRACLLNSAKDSHNRPDLLEEIERIARVLNERYATAASS